MSVMLSLIDANVGSDALARHLHDDRSGRLSRDDTCLDRVVVVQVRELSRRIDKLGRRLLQPNRYRIMKRVKSCRT